MVTVLGAQGMLGSVVARRWAEMGWDGDYVVNCIRPDSLAVTRSLAAAGGLIQPSTDAIAEDTPYAATKRVIEAAAAGAVVIRSGLVDIRHRLAVAYDNWQSNPLTPLEWADLAWEVRDQPGIHVAGREPVTRWALASLIADLWDIPRPLRVTASEPLSRVQPIDRPRPPLHEALIAYRDWLR